MTDAARHISGNDMGYSCRYESADEMGQLCRCLDDMRLKLIAIREPLEADRGPEDSECGICPRSAHSAYGYAGVCGSVAAFLPGWPSTGGEGYGNSSYHAGTTGPAGELYGTMKEIHSMEERIPVQEKYYLALLAIRSGRQQYLYRKQRVWRSK